MRLTLFLPTLLALAITLSSSHECHHKQFQRPVEPFHIPEDLSSRRLQGRDNIRIATFFDMDSSNETIKNTIQYQLVPAAISYYEAALQVDRLSSSLSFPNSYYYSCGWSTSTPLPAAATSGVDADLIILVTTTSSSDNFLAAASACYNLDPQQGGSGRPIMGFITFNTRIGWSKSTEAAYQAQVYTTIHEFGHVLGFSSNLYQYFTTPATTTDTVNGQTVTILQMAPLRQKVQEYFGCNDLEGAYLENEGGTGSKGSHFERRVFFNEVMTSSITPDGRISEFFLALLEGSGWYTPDYNMAEPMFWGKGEGCSFLRTTCTGAGGVSNFPEYFCSTSQVTNNPRTEACSFTGHGEGYCYGGDSFSDGCPYYATYSNRNCRDSSAAIDATVGEATGDDSNCFAGNVAPLGSSVSSGNYCFKKTCESLGGGNYQLRITVGSETVTCTSPGSQPLTGYSGSVTCPDPNTYCITTALEYCPLGCTGRGTCNNGVCSCTGDFGGSSCSHTEGFIIPDQTEETNEEVEGDSSNMKFIIIGAVAGAVALLAATGLCYFIKKKQTSRRQRYIPNSNSAPRGDIRTTHARANHVNNRV